MLSPALAFLHSANLRARERARLKFERTHVLLAEVPNPASTPVQPRAPICIWRFAGWNFGKRYTGAAIRAANVKNGVGSRKTRDAVALKHVRAILALKQSEAAQ